MNTSNSQFSSTSTDHLSGKRDANIGRILLDMGKITPEQAERALRLQKEQGIRFGEAAQRLGFIKEADIQQVIARQFNYAYLQPGQGQFPPELVAAYQPFSEAVETLRAIRSQLMLRWFMAGHKSLTFSSAEAYTSTSLSIANLAVVFSQLGEKTLLIDANLRQPNQHLIFNIHTKQGLSDSLAERIDYVPLSKIEAFSNLCVLSAGTPVPNPQELISHLNFKKLLNTLEQEFDVILIDAPSFSSGADMLTIASNTHGLVLIAHKHHTRIETIQTIHNRIQSTASISLVGSIYIEA